MSAVDRPTGVPFVGRNCHAWTSCTCAPVMNCSPLSSMAARAGFVCVTTGPENVFTSPPVPGTGCVHTRHLRISSCLGSYPGNYSTPAALHWDVLCLTCSVMRLCVYCIYWMLDLPVCTGDTHTYAHNCISNCITLPHCVILSSISYAVTPDMEVYLQWTSGLYTSTAHMNIRTYVRMYVGPSIVCMYMYICTDPT